MKTFLTTILCIAGFTTAAAADNLSGASGRASVNMSGAMAQSVANGSALVGLSVGAPMMAVGEVGNGIVSASTHVIGKPLPIADETIVHGPAPDQALREHEER